MTKRHYQLFIFTLMALLLSNITPALYKYHVKNTNSQYVWVCASQDDADAGMNPFCDWSKTVGANSPATVKSINSGPFVFTARYYFLDVNAICSNVYVDAGQTIRITAKHCYVE